jgi:hypothetical protein
MHHKVILATETGEDVVPVKKVPVSHLIYLAGVRDSAKSGLGLEDNRHLNNHAESIVMNVRDFPETEAIIRR